MVKNKYIKSNEMENEINGMRSATETIIIGNKKYEIAQIDIPSMTFTEALSKEDEKWSIPDFDVLMQMYQLRDKIGGFDHSCKYWCRNTYLNGVIEHDPRDGFVQTVYFGNGLTELLDPDKARCKTRLVREIESEKQ